jgi:quercetin 2,3-dioxygenase
MSDAIIRSIGPLGFQWKTLDPFLFCVHHDDAYPAGNDQMGPDPALLRGRNIGMDFEPRDGWRMYHGDVVPGFPRHPHRGFETITIARSGLIDHSDSLGARGRFGHGDVQWMTAGKGIVHAEMFPLLDDRGPNPCELFQIWINLPAADKFAEPCYKMLWAEDIPRPRFEDRDGRATEVTVFAGALGDAVPPSPPPDSWASRGEADVAVWALAMEPGARWTLPAARRGDVTRTLYFFAGDSLSIDGRTVARGEGFMVRPDVDIALECGSVAAEVLMLQGRPIGEPVAQQGPFVMNTLDEIRQAMMDYQATAFGGWPWKRDDPVHGRERGRFAQHTDGTSEDPGGEE